jgi:hypothetical protein
MRKGVNLQGCKTPIKKIDCDLLYVNLYNKNKMRLRNGKQYPVEITITSKEKILTKMREIHIHKLKELFYVINTNGIIALDKKAMIICEIYKYIYNIFRELVALQDIHAYSKLLKNTLKNIPVLTQQCIEVINRNNRKNILVNNIKPYLQCIEQLSKVQQLSNELI